jgi:peroxiredoxin
MATPTHSVAEEYNYKTFTSSEARGKTKSFINVLHAGEEAPDFDLVTPEGEHVSLSQFRGQKNVLLEFGAIT